MCNAFIQVLPCKLTQTNHFFLSQIWLKPIVWLTMPASRPMDNMASGPDLPQEDEFAICTLGGPTPYLSMAFPNLPRPHQNLIDMKDVSEKDRSLLAKTLSFFTKALTLRHRKRLLLKSPPHTGRIEFLREQFPGAKFIHITRDPYRVIPSTIRLWQRLDRVNGFQIPNYSRESLKQYVLRTFRKMYEAFAEQTALRLEETAYVFWKREREDDARACLAAAGSLTNSFRNRASGSDSSRTLIPDAVHDAP